MGTTFQIEEPPAKMLWSAVFLCPHDSKSKHQAIPLPTMTSTKISDHQPKNRKIKNRANSEAIVARIFNMIATSMINSMQEGSGKSKKDFQIRAFACSIISEGHIVY